MEQLNNTARVMDTARAKVNLALHITGQQNNGYHLLDSLVIFPKVGDEITVEPASTLSLNIQGPFAGPLQGETKNNLVYRAAQLLAELHTTPHQVAITLTKNLPIAAGIGGGSADAAATLRALIKLWGVQPDPADVASLALQLGADVPMCLEEKPARIRGIGEQIEPISPLPSGAIVLVNPRVEMPTPAVFAALANKDNTPLPELPHSFQSLKELANTLKSCRNDLEAPAIQLSPVIGEVLEILKAQPETALARMSGSGATCFALCTTLTEAQSLCNRLCAAKPEWWVTAAQI